MHIKVYNVQVGLWHCIIGNIHLFSILTLPWLQFIVGTSQLPGPRANHCAVIIKGSMFIFGGDDVDNNFSYFSQISLPFNSASQWRSLTMKGAIQVSDPACVVTQDNKLLVIGGIASTKSSATSTFLQAYDPDAQTWTAQNITSGPYPFHSLRGHVAVTTQNAIFVFGGYNVDPNPTYLLQSMGQNSWQVIQYPQQRFSPPIDLIHPGSSIINGRVFVIGGENINGNMTTKIYAFDVESVTWISESQSVQPACTNCTIVAVNNGKAIDVISPGSPHPVQLLSIGGQPPGVVGVNSVDSSPPQPSTPSSFPAPLKGYSAVIFNQDVYIYGGITANGSTSDTFYQFNMLTNNWTIPAENPIPTMTSSTSSSNGQNNPMMANGGPPAYATGSSTSSNLSLIFGCIIGILAFIALVGLIIYWLRVKRTKNTRYITNNDSRHISSGYALGGIGRGKGQNENASDVAFVSRLMRRLSLLNKNVVNAGSTGDTQRLQPVGEGGSSIISGRDDANDNGSESGPAVFERTGSGIAAWGDAVGFDLETFSTPGITAVTIFPKEL